MIGGVLVGIGMKLVNGAWRAVWPPRTFFAAGGLDPIDVSGREAIHHHVQQTPEGYVFKDSAQAGVAQRKQLLHSPTARAKKLRDDWQLDILGPSAKPVVTAYNSPSLRQGPNVDLDGSSLSLWTAVSGTREPIPLPCSSSSAIPMPGP